MSLQMKARTPPSSPRNGEPPSPMRMKGKMKRHPVPPHFPPHPRAMMDRPSLVEVPQRFGDKPPRHTPYLYLLPHSHDRCGQLSYRASSFAQVDFASFPKGDTSQSPGLRRTPLPRDTPPHNTLYPNGVLYVRATRHSRLKPPPHPAPRPTLRSPHRPNPQDRRQHPRDSIRPEYRGQNRPAQGRTPVISAQAPTSNNTAAFLRDLRTIT